MEIRKIRKELGMSRAEFGAALGVSPRTVEAWEQGWRKPSKTAMILIKKMAEKGR